jgi:hypothetical protein
VALRLQLSNQTDNMAAVENLGKTRDAIVTELCKVIMGMLTSASGRGLQ